MLCGWEDNRRSVESNGSLPPVDDLSSYRKSGLGNTMVTSEFCPEVEIWPFCACAMKNMQFGPYLWPNRRNSRVLYEIRVGEHDDDVRFLTGSHGLVNSAMGQIPCSTERISCSKCVCAIRQETLVAECDLGRDYEHCLELQKKVNDTEAVSDGV